MEFGGINPLGVLAAALAGFLASAAYHAAFVARRRRAAGITLAEARPRPARLISILFCHIVMAWVLAGLIGHLGQGQTTIRNGMISAGFVWTGFVITTQIANDRFQNRPWRPVLIDGAHWLLVLLVQGAAIGLVSV